MTTPHWTGSVQFTAGGLRAESFPVASYPYLGEVWGDFSKARQYRLMELARRFVPIPGASLAPG